MVEPTQTKNDIISPYFFLWLIFVLILWLYDQCPEWEPSGNKDTWQVDEDESDENDVDYVGTVTNEDRIIDNIGKI